MINLFRFELFSRWRAILVWGSALALFASMYIFIFPEMAEELEGLAGISIYRAMGMDLGSFAGFIASVVVQIMPIIMGVYVIIVGTGTLAGEEDNGTLELVVALPLPRWQIVATKFAALALVILGVLAVMGAGSALSLSIINTSIETDVTPGQLFVALLGAYPLMLAFLAIAMFLAATVPNRFTAVAIMAVIYVSSYLIQSMTRIVDSLDWLEPLSLFAYLDSSPDVFQTGLAADDVLLLLAVTAIFLALTLLSFQVRNITTGSWSWQRGQTSAV